MYRLRLILRGLLFRRGLTAAVLVVGVITTAAAALGPMFARGAGESTLQDHFTADAPRTNLHFTASVNLSQPDVAQKLAAKLPTPGSIRGYDSRVLSFLSNQPQAVGGVLTKLAWRQGFCQHVVTVAGQCPTGPNQVMVSERSLASGELKWKVGQTLVVGGFLDYSFGDKAQNATVKLTIVGIYRPVNAGALYWGPDMYFDSHQHVGVGDGPEQIDSLFLAEDSLTDPTLALPGTVEADYPLHQSQIRLADVPRLVSDVNGLKHRYASAVPVPGAVTPQLIVDVNGVVKEAKAERHLVEIGTAIVTLQLGLLAWLVLFHVVSDAIEARGNEIALAKIRGLRRGATLRFGLGEPLVLLALAVPIGVGAALLVTKGFAESIFVAGTPARITAWSLVAALVAFAGGLLAAGLAAHKTLTRSVLDQWRRTTHDTQRGRLLLAADILLAVAAVAGFVALRARHHAVGQTDTAALLAPGLLVFAVGLLGVRLLPPLCRRLARRSRASHRVATFLASRQVGRRPAGIRLATLLAVAVGLAAFAVAGESVASTNRQHRAQGELGAAQVLTIQRQPGHDPVAAVRAADPDGRWAMAAGTWLPDGGDSVTGTVLAVDSTRLRTVAYNISGGPSLASLASTIGTVRVPPITFSSTTIRLTVAASGLTPGPTPDVQINLRDAAQTHLTVDLGRLRPGQNTYTGAVTCTGTCTFTGLTWNRPFDATEPQAGTVRVSAMAVRSGSGWKDVDLHLADAGAWRSAPPQGEATDAVRVTPTGVVDRYTNTNGGYGGIVYSLVPAHLPTVATPAAIATDVTRPDPLGMTDAAGNNVPFDVVHYARVLPAVLDNGLIVDLTAARISLPALDDELNWQVWLSPSAPSDARAKLTAAGVSIQSGTTAKARVTVLARQGPALSLLLLLACAIAGAMLGAAGTAISISASSRRRSYELAAMQAIGVRRSTLTRASMLEQLLLLGSGVVLGVPTGWLAARLAMPVIPEFSDPTPVVSDYAPKLAPTVLFALFFVLLLLLTSYVAARALMRIAVPTRLRESE